MIPSRIELLLFSSHQAFNARISNHIDHTKMAEYLLSDFYGFQGECVQKEIMEEVDNIENKHIYGEKVCVDYGKRKRAECQSQLESKKMKNEEEDPEKNTCIDDLPNELLQLILSNLETEDVVTAGQTCRRWFSVGRRVWQKMQLEEHICLLCNGEAMEGLKLGFYDPNKIRTTKFHYASCLFQLSPKLYYDQYPHRQVENENGDPLERNPDILGRVYKYLCKERGCTNKRKMSYKDFAIHQATDHEGLGKLIEGHENPKVRTVVNRLLAKSATKFVDKPHCKCLSKNNSVGDRICQQKAEEIEASWKMPDYVPTPAEVNWASLLAKHCHLLRKVITTKAEELEASWSNECYPPPLDDNCASSLADLYTKLQEIIASSSNDDYTEEWRTPSPAEVHYASSLAENGYLSRQVITDMADEIVDLGDPDLAQVQCAAALVTRGYITQVERLWLGNCGNLDMSLMPAEDLRRLVKCCVDVAISGVTGGLSTVLSSVQCRRIIIANMRLSTADTQQLVAAMDTRVKSVVLYSSGVTLDMDTLAQYDGMGECGEVKLFRDTKERYRDQVKAWAENMGWQVQEISRMIFIKRK